MSYLSLIPIFTLLYLMLLFIIAYFGDRLKEKGKSLAANPYVYSLSLAVYCTAWTFYGSVGLFTHHGFLYMPIYIGATFAAFTWWHTLKKFIEISKVYNTTSIADFISTRYGKSRFLAGLIALMILIGIMPYIALQLKAITNTLHQLYFFDEKKPDAALTFFLYDYSFYIAVILSIFGALFGARKLDVTERHEGMVLAIAFEGIVKLIAFLAVGIYVTYFIFDGYKDILQQGSVFPEIKQFYTIGTDPGPSYFQWFNLILLSGVAVMLLPRQFHMSVIESHDKNHVRKAMFLFPLYLFLISFFVPAVAIGGRLLGLSPAEADLYVLKIPIMRGVEILSILAFVGGFSAATGMLIVETVAVSTMLVNHVISPFIVKLKLKRLDLSFLLIHLKRFCIVVIMLFGYAYFKIIGETKILVDIGLMSFCAILQFAPATFLGIYWERANGIGAITGIIFGYLIWFFTLFIPSLSASIPALNSVTTDGLFGIGMLKPSALFYLSGLDIWSHSMFWSLLFNFFFLITFSIIFSQTETEVETADNFVNIDKAEAREAGVEPKKHISRSPSNAEYTEFLAKFIGKIPAEKAMENFLKTYDIKKTDLLSSQHALLQRIFVERTLAAHIGAATAKNILDNYLKVHGTKIVEIFDIFHDVSESLKQSRENLAVRLKELSLLYSSLEKILSTLDESEIMDSVINILVKNFNADGCAIILLDIDYKLRIKKHFGLDEETARSVEFDYATTYAGKSFEEMRVFQVEDVEQAAFPPKISRLMDGSPVLSLAVAPIVVTGIPLGVVVIFNKEKRFFTEQFTNFFQGIANQLGLALKNAELYKELNELNKNLEMKVNERTVELERKSMLLEEANKHLKEVDRLKSQFLSAMSHELRTPLNSIIGYTQLILDGIDGEISSEQREDLSRIERNAKHLLQLINDILDLSKIEAGRMDLNISKVDLQEVVDQALTIILPLAAGKNIKIVSEIRPNEVFLLADRQRLEQIIINLLSNSIKFTNEGAVTVGFKTATDSLNKSWAEIYVKDTGIGVAAENLVRIFEAFKQVEDTSTRKHGGTGLGLSITKKLVEMHGGAIWVESTSGEGTTMTFTLPLAEAELAVIPYTKEVSLLEPEEKQKSKLVVIVEEREDILQILYDFLSKEGYKVEYTSLSDAMNKIKSLRPLSIVIDLLLSEKDGWELLRKLKQDRETSNIPIIIISIEGDTKMGYTVGPVDYIIKPLIKEDVIRELKKIEQTLENKYVYVVDDDPDVLKMLEKIMIDAGYNVKTLSSGRELIESLIIEIPGVILLDLFMPEISGFDVIEYIRNEPKLADLPIIVITGGDLSLAEKKMLEQSVKKIFIKSMLDKNTLLMEIKKSLENLKGK